METESENSNSNIGQNDHSNPSIESTTILSDNTHIIRLANKPTVQARVIVM